MESSPQAHERGGQNEVAGPRTTPSEGPGPLAWEIAALWGECLDGREVAPDDDFFAIGGNSLIGIKIIDRVSKDYGVELSVRDFYLAVTPARVAELVEQGRAAR